MNLSGNTIFITGGGSGIGWRLAEVFHQRGNTVIIAGRRLERLQATLQANPGMTAVQLDVEDPTSIDRIAAQLIDEHPELNVLINNAGIMVPDGAAGRMDDALITRTVTTNLLGPIRLTSALIEHIKTKQNAAVVYVSSALAFVPMALTAVYSATKAGLHSYALSQRFLLKDAGVKVFEIAPPWVRTELMNSQEAELAMPLDDFIAQTEDILATDADEIVVRAAQAFRDNPGPHEHALVDGFNAQITAYFSKDQHKAG